MVNVARNISANQYLCAHCNPMKVVEDKCTTCGETNHIYLCVINGKSYCNLACYYGF